ncbi:hypothetical protein [Erythrobacter litoralis]|uniref:hypothetical protein n=1 Tax=Erythrobacter litoralis TaxID=39960 RepID=UPI002435626E|nr:hypothetical protein [Erythrobacter litoralis]
METSRDVTPDDTTLLETLEKNAEPDPSDNCLLLLWSEQDAPDITFDRANDTARGGAISCATGTTPSQFRAAIETLREAARSGDKARLLEQVGIPLLYIDGEGARRELSQDEINTVFDEVFDQQMLMALRKLDLSDITVENRQGAYFQLGTLWLVVDKQGGRPRLVTVNRQALEEAARAAQREAQAGTGRALERAE